MDFVSGLNDVAGLRIASIVTALVDVDIGEDNQELKAPVWRLKAWVALLGVKQMMVAVPCCVAQSFPLTISFTMGLGQWLFLALLGYMVVISKGKY